MEKMNRKLRPENSLRKVAYYIRCSTEEQNESPEGTIKNQEERLALTLKLKTRWTRVTETTWGLTPM